MEKILILIVELLSWDYITTGDKNLAKIEHEYYLKKASCNENRLTFSGEEKGDTPIIYPTSLFRDVFLSADFISLIVNTHIKVANLSGNLPTFSCQAVLLISSVKGEIFQSEEEELGYLSSILIPILKSTIIPDEQSMSFPSDSGAEQILLKCRLFSRLMTNFSFSIFLKMPNIADIIKHLSHYTCLCYALR